MDSKRRSNRLHLSSHANVRSTRSRNAWIAALNSRVRPRLVALRLRGFSLMFGIIPALKIALRFDLAVKHDTSIFRRTDQMIHQDGNIVALMDIFAHTSDDNGSRQAKQASGNLTPRD